MKTWTVLNHVNEEDRSGYGGDLVRDETSESVFGPFFILSKRYRRRRSGNDEV